jgi:hypothetical protein
MLSFGKFEILGPADLFDRLMMLDFKLVISQ